MSSAPEVAGDYRVTVTAGHDDTPCPGANACRAASFLRAAFGRNAWQAG